MPVTIFVNQPVPTHQRRSATVPAMGFGLALLLALVMPTSFLVQGPGPVLEVSGEYEGEPLVTVTGEPTYETDTEFYMTTVSSYGNADGGVTGIEVLRALATDTLDTVPVRALYSQEVTSEQVSERNAELMTSSQDIAAAVALERAGYDVHEELTVVGFSDQSPAVGKLKENDIIRGISSPTSKGNVPVKTYTDVSRVMEKTPPGSLITVLVKRDGKEMPVQLTSKAYEPDVNGWINPGSLIGVYLNVSAVDLPAKVEYLVDGVGGPSAGSMFTLSIYDQLTDGSLGGDNKIAGTGTIAWDGKIGAIGGIEHKLEGAKRQGAQYFLAPETNCRDVIGNIPGGLDVFAVATIDDAIDVAEAIANGDTSALRSCADVLPAAQN